MKRILITGSQGFIGSYLCQDLLRHKYEVVGIDNFSKYGWISRPQDCHPNFTLFDHDVIDIEDISSLGDFDTIIAGAAMIGGIQYFHKYAYDLLATNERIMASTFDYAIKQFRQGSLSKIVVLSSSMVFENTDVYPTPETQVKLSPPPSSTYGFQKLAVEYFCKGAHEQYGLPYIVIRPFNCIGVGEGEAIGEEQVSQGNIKMQLSHVVPDLIYKCLKIGSDGPLPILGEGKQVRHYTHGADIARGVRMAMETPEATNNDFNISSNVSTTVMELANLIWDKIYPYDDFRCVHEAPMRYDVRMRSPDTTKAREVLGFACEISLDEALDEIIKWVKNTMVN